MLTSVRSVATVLCLATGTPALAGELIYGVTQNQVLVSWNSAAPGSILSGMPLWGLAANETVQGIDLRPGTGELFALGSFSNFYRVNPLNGQASLVAPLSVALNGSSFGFDFNPRVDRIRTVSDADQNLRSVPDSGMTFLDGTLAYAMGDAHAGVNPNIVGAAYTNNFAGSTTTLYVVDSGLDILAIQNPANSGQLTTVGHLGTDVTDIASFDISGNSGIAFMVVRDATLAKSTFWTIDLMSGQGTLVGEVGGGSIITAMTVVPSPGALALVGVGGLVLARRRR